MTPPSNNMGAEITAPAENRSLIDWLSWTLKTTDVDLAIDQCGFASIPFVESKGGGMGYRSSRRAGNIVVFYDGSENMGVHFSITGQGCRQYEQYATTAHCWYQLLVRLSAIGANFTRIDLAIDNIDGALDLDKLEECILAKSVSSRFKGGHKINQFSFTEDKNEGRTIYLGSPTSRFKIRFYDKAAQLNIKTHWVRCELQCMAERSQEVVRHLLKNIDVGHIAVSALNSYFRPINNDDSNKSRCSTQSWWSAWLTTTEKIKLTTAKAIKLIDEVVDHIKRQYSPTLAMLRKYFGVSQYHELMREIIEDGKKRLTKKHEIIIQCTQLVRDVPF